MILPWSSLGNFGLPSNRLQGSRGATAGKPQVLEGTSESVGETNGYRRAGRHFEAQWQ